MIMMLQHLFTSAFTNTAGTADISVPPWALHWNSPSSWAILTLLCLTICAAVCIDWLFAWPTRHIPLKPERACAFAPHLVPTTDKAGKRIVIDTIVIGSGSGGCAAANLLAQSGQTVLILEQHVTRTGGCTHSFRDRGCEWDTGLHYTSAAMGSPVCRPGAIMDFMTRGLQQWTPLKDPYDQVVFPPDNHVEHQQHDESDAATNGTSTDGTNGVTNGGTTAANGTAADGTKSANGTNGDGMYPNKSVYSFVRGVDATVQSVLDNIDPLDRKGLKKRAMRYMDLCQRINSGFTALGLSRILPSWLQFLVQKRVDDLMTYASMTVRDVQYAMFNLDYTPERLLKEGCPKAPAGPESDPCIRRLKAVLTHPIGDYAVQPRDATMAAHGVTMSHYIDGASYPVGATQQISIRTSSMVRATDGEVLVDATVREIMVENGRAVGVKVSNTSALQEAAKQGFPADEVPVTEIRAKNIVFASSIYNLYGKLLPKDLEPVQDFSNPAKRTVCQSHGHIFLFCKIQGDATELNLPTHNLWYFNGYDMDEAFDEYFANPREVRPPTVYVGFPCTKDTTWKKRFPGVSNCILISDGLWEWFEEWKDKPVHERGADYEKFKDALSKHLLDILYETVPEVKGKVEFHILGTPLTEATYLGSFCGGSYGTKCTTTMFDEINRKWTTTPHTPIPGLSLAGSDAFLPAVCGAMYGGCFGACAVLGPLGTIKLTLALMTHFATCIKKENPKMSWMRAYIQAWDRFVNE